VRTMQNPTVAATASFGLSLVTSMLRSWRGAWGGRAVEPATWLFLDIEDAVDGARMGWGPEIADLHRRLARLAASIHRSACHGVQLRGTAFRMTFETGRPKELQAALVRAIDREAMAPFAEILVCSSADASATRRVWRGGGEGLEAP
jgi:hypothetical protein